MFIGLLLLDLPNLLSIELEEYAFQGDYRKNRKSLDLDPFNFKNTLKMKSI